MASPRVHTQRLRDEHREFLPHIEMLRTAADLLGAAGDEEARAALDDVGPFLATRLAPHMVAEDEVLYPLLEEAMGVPGAAGTLRRDHRQIRRLSDELTWLQAQAAGGPIGADRQRDLRRVLYELHGIVKLHVASEEADYLPTLDAWLTDERTERLFEAMLARGRQARAEATS